MRRIRRFGVVRTANVFAIIYFLISLIIVIPVALIASAGPMVVSDPSTGRSYSVDFGSPVFLIIVPIIYGGIGWIFTAIGCLIYNLAATFTGGIEVQVEGEAPSAAAWQSPPAGWQPPPQGWQPPPSAPGPTSPPPAPPPADTSSQTGG